MEATVRKQYQNEWVKQDQSVVRDLVMEGYAQAQRGNTKDFDMVCDRLEKKYKSGI